MKKIEDEVVWVHCVSVGEFIAAKILIDKLLKTHKILVTTTTKTASVEVLKYYQNRVFHLYFPFDCPFIVKQYISKINPKMMLILETEIWANCIHYLHKNNTPVLIVNARLSAKSFNKYQKISKLTQQTLNKISLILTQNDASKQRFIKLGMPSNKLKTTGNIKFDQNFTNLTRIKLPINKQKKVVLFASTHQNEEAQILDAYLKVKQNLNVLLIIVPRHPERFQAVFDLMRSHKIKICKRSDNQVNDHCEIMLGDSMGEMMAYFEVSDIVFMGGSLSDTGGHNMLEPAALAKPILFGENVFNFAQISTDLLEQGAALQVQNADELFEKIMQLLNNEKQGKKLGMNAQTYFQSKQGVVDKILTKINKVLLR